MKTVTKVCAVIEHNHRILLIKEWSTKKNGYFWNVVKGTYGDVKNESLSDCVIREAKEEVNLQVSVDKLISFYYFANEEVCYSQFNFLVLPEDTNATLAKIEDQKARNEEIVEVKWFTKKELQKLNPDELISNRTLNVIKDWMTKNFYLYKQLSNVD